MAGGSEGERWGKLGLIPNTLYDKQDVESIVSIYIAPLESLPMNAGMSGSEEPPFTKELLYLPTGVQTKEGFEYKFVRPLRG